MLLALSGITGVGKSYYSEQIQSKLNFNKVHTIRTRQIRKGEENGKTGLFMTNEELEKLKKTGEIVYDFEVFGGRYGYKKEEILSNENYVFEMHYTTIYDFRQIRPDIVAIYLIPNDIKKAEEQLRKRNLPKEKEQNRIDEIHEQYDEFMNNKNLQKQFDYIIYNNYDEESEEELMKLIEKILKES